MSMLTLGYCSRLIPVKNSTTKCNQEMKKSSSSNCQDAAPSQDLDAPHARPENANPSEAVLEESGMTYKKPRLRRPSKNIPFRGTAKTRNAYLNFMDEYRRSHKNLLPWQVMSQAASCWKRLSEDEKSKYKTDAQSVKYSYKSKNKALNKVLSALKNSVAPKEIDVSQLIKASRQLKFWKEEVLHSIEFEL